MTSEATISRSVTIIMRQLERLTDWKDDTSIFSCAWPVRRKPQVGSGSREPRDKHRYLVVEADLTEVMLWGPPVVPSGPLEESFRDDIEVWMRKCVDAGVSRIIGEFCLTLSGFDQVDDFGPISRTINWHAPTIILDTPKRDFGAIISKPHLHLGTRSGRGTGLSPTSW